MPSPPLQLWFFGIRAYTRALGFAYSHPALFRPGVWRLALAASVLLAIVSIVLGLAVLVVSFGLLLVAGAGLIGWYRLMRQAERPILAFISRLAPSTPEAYRTTVDHQLALLDGLNADPLAQVVEGRKLSPLRRVEAERILSACASRLVLYGEARVQGDKWLAQGGILIDAERRELDGSGNRSQGPPPRHKGFRDASLDVEDLVSDGFSARHAEILRAELLDLAAALK